MGLTNVFYCDHNGSDGIHMCGMVLLHDRGLLIWPPISPWAVNVSANERNVWLI